MLLKGEKMDYTIVGKIINTHGVRGEVKIYPLTDDINRFDYLKEIYIGEDKIHVNVQSVKYHKGMPLLKFKEYSDINDILKFKDSYIYVDDVNKVVLPENHFFISDLINCNVYDVDGNPIGILSEVLQGYSNDVYVIKDEKKNKEYLIPVVKEFVKDVNVKDKSIVIDPIEGMIE
jgi:16S rRNA processing protein RimM